MRGGLGEVEGRSTVKMATRRPAAASTTTRWVRPGRRATAGSPAPPWLADVMHHRPNARTRSTDRVVGIVPARDVGSDHLGLVQGHVQCSTQQAKNRRDSNEAQSPARRPRPGGVQAGVKGHAFPIAGRSPPAMRWPGAPRPREHSSASTWPPPARSRPKGRDSLDSGGTRRSPRPRRTEGGRGSERGADRRGQRRGAGLHQVTGLPWAAAAVASSARYTPAPTMAAAVFSGAGLAEKVGRASE